MTGLRWLPRILMAILTALAAAPELHAAKQIGVIMASDIPYYRAMHEAFVAELNGRNTGGEEIEILLQRPFPDPISWSNAARKLIAYDVDLIVSYGLPATQAVLLEKSRIPVVYAGVYEPDQAGLKGRNVTGCGFKIPLSSILRYLKGLQAIRTLAIVYSGIEPDSVRQSEAMKELTGQQSIETELIDLRSRAGLDRLRAAKPDAAFITGSSLAYLQLDEIISILGRQRTPAADLLSDETGAGVVMTLLHPPRLQGQMAADLATRILLLGAKPGELEVQTLRDTELVLNLREARRLGLTIPVNLLVEATRVIQ